MSGDLASFFRQGFFEGKCRAASFNEGKYVVYDLLAADYKKIILLQKVAFSVNVKSIKKFHNQGVAL